LVKLSISTRKRQERVEKVQLTLQEKGIDLMLLYKPISIFYLTGYGHISTERPLAMLVPANDEIGFFLPLLEVDFVLEKCPHIKQENITTYFDYPAGNATRSPTGEVKHPMKLLAELIESKGFGSKKIAADAPGAPTFWGYLGPKLAEVLPNARIELLPELIIDIRMIKDEEEIALIKESAKWGNLAHQYLQEFVELGVSEIEISLKASFEASKAMLRTFGPDYEMEFYGRAFPARAGFRGQIGPHSALPHSISKYIKIKKGDILITGAGSHIGGYNSELERTMIVGEPTEKQKRLFEVMLAAQTAGLETFGPGVKCSEVDKAATKVIKEAGYSNLLRHHTGHALGMEGHERPFLDVGDETVMQRGMVFSCEPGIYELGYAGFRHSDTVWITEDGFECITYYPRDLESLTIF